MQIDGYGDFRLAAELIVADHRPHDENRGEHREQPGGRVGKGDRQSEPAFLLPVLAERRAQVIGRHEPIP